MLQIQHNAMFSPYVLVHTVYSQYDTKQHCCDIFVVESTIMQCIHVFNLKRALLENVHNNYTKKHLFTTKGKVTQKSFSCVIYT